jgi:acetoin utilization deacetylase AcuC-like enzyme
VSVEEQVLATPAVTELPALAYVFSPRALEFEPPPVTVQVGGRRLEMGTMNVSNPLLTRLAHEVAEASGLLDGLPRIDPEPVPLEVLLAVHEPDYVERVRAASLEGGPWEADFAPIGPKAWDAARLAAGGAVAAVDAVIDGRAERALVQLRPPGHHAEAARAMGACYFNNVACAAERARALGAERVMIVDWDVHIGNGAERIFWDRPDVLTLSIHQRDWYPDGGLADSLGGRGAEGATVNVPIPPGATNAAYLQVLEQVVAPIARAFRPDLFVVAAGVDPSIFDPMGRMLVSAAGFGAMAEWLCELANEVSEGRVVACMEGGYSHMYSPFCAAATLGGMTGRVPELIDPFEGDAELRVALGPPDERVERAIEAVRKAQRRWFG